MEDWAQVLIIQGLIDSYASGVIPSGSLSSPDVVSALEVSSMSPSDKEANVTLEDLRFIEISFNDVPMGSGISLEDYIELSYRSVIN